MPQVNKVSTFSTDLHRKYILAARFNNQVSGIWEKTVINENLPKGQGGTLNWPKYGGWTASAVTDGTPFSIAQTISTSNVALTPSKAAIMWIMTKKAQDQASENVANAAGTMASNGIKLYVDQQGVALASGYSQTVGGSGTLPTADQIPSGVSLIWGNTTETGMNGNGGGQPGGAGAITSMMHPFAYRPLASDLVGYGATGNSYPIPDGPSAMILKDVTMGRIHGTSVVLNPNITLSNSVAQNMIYGKNSALICWWEKFNEDSQKDVTVFGDVSIVSTDFAVAELNDSFGVYWQSSAPTPS